MGAHWECRCERAGGAVKTANDCPRCPRLRKDISVKSKPAFCCCRRNASRSRPDAARWCGRFLVSCLGEADAIFHRLYAQMRELNWLGAETMVVVVGDGAEWIWNRATWFVRRCEILDFWHAVEHAWGFARLRYGDGSTQADLWVQAIAEDLRAGHVKGVIARLKRLRPNTADLRQCQQSSKNVVFEARGRQATSSRRRRQSSVRSSDCAESVSWQDRRQ